MGIRLAVDGAIHNAAGSQLLEECMKLDGCPEGESKITLGFDLPSKYVIHTVGPYWEGGQSNERNILTSCYQSSLELAAKHNVKRIAFPAISCGIFGFPVDSASEIAINTTIEFINSNAIPEEITFVCFGEAIYNAYTKTLNNHSELF